MVPEKHMFSFLLSLCKFSSPSQASHIKQLSGAYLWFNLGGCIFHLKKKIKGSNEVQLINSSKALGRGINWDVGRSRKKQWMRPSTIRFRTLRPRPSWNIESHLCLVFTLAWSLSTPHNLPSSSWAKAFGGTDSTCFRVPFSTFDCLMSGLSLSLTGFVADGQKPGLCSASLSQFLLLRSIPKYSFLMEFKCNCS